MFLLRKSVKKLSEHGSVSENFIIDLLKSEINNLNYSIVMLDKKRMKNSFFILKQKITEKWYENLKIYIVDFYFF